MLLAKAKRCDNVRCVWGKGGPSCLGWIMNTKMMCAVYAWKYMLGPELNVESNKKPLKVRCL